MITFEKLNAGATSPWWEVFDYDHLTGKLSWRVNPTRGAKVLGHDVGTKCMYGYYVLTYKRKQHRASRVIWEMFNGTTPPSMYIDHINRNRADDRLDNLRLASPMNNSHNAKRAETNKSGIKGVRLKSLRSGRVRWEAAIQHCGLRVFKYFEGTETGRVAALNWIQAQREALHKDFASNG